MTWTKQTKATDEGDKGFLEVGFLVAGFLEAVSSWVKKTKISDTWNKQTKAS